MGSHDTGIYLNTISTESSGMRRRHPTDERCSADTISPVCEPSEISTPIDDDAADTDKPRHDVRTRTSFEKTSTWLLQQDSSQAAAVKETDVVLERATQSNIYIGSNVSDVDLTPTVTSSHSEPVLLQNVTLGDNDVGMARSSVTIIASTPSEQAFADCNSASSVSAPACQNSSRQKTRQLRFSCAVPAVEDSRNIRDSKFTGSHTFPSKNVTIDTEEPDGGTCSTRNDVEELSMEDGASVANSNTSLSDTCNSSFMSSTEDLANHDVSGLNESGMLAASSAADITPRVSNLRGQHSPGLRHRKRRTVNDSQRLHSLSPAHLCERVRQVEEGVEDCGGNKICHECDSVVPDSGGGLRQSVDTAAATASELPRAAVSSDEDDDENASRLSPRISPSKCRLLHPRHARRPCSARAVRSSEKFPCHSPAADKDWGVRVEGRRSNVKIMDVRLLESTGISSADSDGEAARLSATKSPSPSKASNTAVYFLPGSCVSDFSCFDVHAVHRFCLLLFVTNFCYYTWYLFIHTSCNYYLCRRLASESIVALGIRLSRCVCVRVRRAAYVTYRLHATLVLAEKVMRCIQCCLVANCVD